MNPFDANIIHFFNQFSQQSPFRDYFIYTISTNFMLTTALLACILWWGWFRNDANGKGPAQASALLEDRKIVLSGICLSVAAIFVARGLAVVLPFRQRPFLNPAIHFRIPFGLDVNGFYGWSSFPSDHAALFFTFGMVIFCLSRRLGIAVWCYFFFASCVPLVYQGVHYPTDILAGALIGIAIGSLVLSSRVKEYLSAAPLRWLKRSPGTFYPCLFLVTFLLGNMFDPLRHLATASVHAVREILHSHA